MADTFRDGIERAAREDLFTREELDEVLKLGTDICDYIEKCRTGLQLDGGIRAGVDYLLRNHALPLLARRPKELVERSVSIAVTLDAKFRDFQTAFLAAGGFRQPKSIDAKGWDAARKVFIRLVTKQKHNPDAIVTGTAAYAVWVAFRGEREIEFVPAPEKFLNKEWFTRDWRCIGAAPTGHQRGATNLFEVGFGHHER